MPGRLLILVVTFAFFALACAAPTSQQPAGTGGSEPKPGGTLSIRETFDPFDWDISYGGKSNAAMIGRAYDTLLAFKAGPGIGYTDFQLRPEIAERWEVSPDARTFTYYLRKDVKWADMAPVNGRDLTAADAKWSFEYWGRLNWAKEKKLPTGEYSWIFEDLESIETVDPYTISLRFKHAYVPFVNYAANEHIPVIAKEIYETDGHFKDQIAGSGPFQLDLGASQKGTRWVWKKNPSYMNGGRPYLDAIRDVILPDDSTAAAAFTTGQIDMTDAAMPVRDAEELAKKDPSAIAHLYLEATAKEMYLNPARPPLNDVRVRKAILYAMDRDELVKVRTDGKGAWAMAGGLVSTFTQDEVKKMIPYDVEQAKRLLREAGFPNGLDIQFEYPTDRGGDEIAEAELLQSQLKKAGINLVLKGMPYAQYSTMKKNKEHVMNVTNRSYGGDIDYALYRIFHPKSKNAYDSIDDAKLVQMLEAQRRETNLEKREQIVREAVKYINVDIALGRALYHNALYQLWKPYVKNYAPHKGHRSHYMTETWLDK